MRHNNHAAVPIAAAIAGLALLGACDVDQTQEGELPDVDVNASGGQLPAYDVDTKDVDVNMTEEQVEVPDVDVSTEEQTVEVPTIRVEE